MEQAVPRLPPQQPDGFKQRAHKEDPPFAEAVVAELEKWFERQAGKERRSGYNRAPDCEGGDDDDNEGGEKGEKSGSSSASTPSVSAAHSQGDLAELADLHHLTEFVSNWVFADRVAQVVLQRPDLLEKLVECLPHLNVVPLLFLGVSASVNELQEMLVEVGVIPNLKKALHKAAELVDSTSAEVVSEGRVGTIVHALCTTIYVMGSDHSQNFANLKPIAKDLEAVRGFGRIFARTWAKGAGPLAELSILAAGKLASSLADLPEEAEAFVSITQFPALPATQYQATPTLGLACHLMQAYAAGDAAGHVLNQFPAILNAVMDAVQDPAYSQAGKAAMALFNGTDSEAGSEAVIPFAGTLVEVFSRAAKYSDTWNGTYGALGNLSRYVKDESLTYLRELKVHNLFHPLMHSTNTKDHPADAASIVANLIGHVEQHPLLKASDNIIGIVHHELKQAWKNEDLEGRTSEPWEPLQGLANLSVNDTNKPLIANTCLDLVLEILESSRPKAKRTVEYAIKIIANLAVTNALCGQHTRILRDLEPYAKAASPASLLHGTVSSSVIKDAGLTLFRIKTLNTMDTAAAPVGRHTSLRRTAAAATLLSRAATVDETAVSQSPPVPPPSTSQPKAPTVTKVQVGGGKQATPMFAVSRARAGGRGGGGSGAADDLFDGDAARYAMKESEAKEPDAAEEQVEEDNEELAHGASDHSDEDEKGAESVPVGKKSQQKAKKKKKKEEKKEEDPNTVAVLDELLGVDAAEGHTTAPGAKKKKRRQEMAAEAEAKAHVTRGHVMLSYPWKYQGFMLRVRSALEESGYRVWMDVDEVSGSILEAMSTGVEKADLVLICLCEAYKTSTACRTEGEYAYKLGKPIVPVRPEVYVPDGWLGALCANLLYVDFAKDDKLFWAAQKHMLLQQVRRYAQPALANDASAHNGGRGDDGGASRDAVDWRMRAISAEQRLRELMDKVSEDGQADNGTSNADARDKAAPSHAVANGRTASTETNKGGNSKYDQLLQALTRIEERLDNPVPPAQGVYCNCCICA